MALEDALTDPRESRLALVVARLDVAGEPHWLLRRHQKWRDWSLVGGHVEPDEQDDWSRTAKRETAEELEPLHLGVDVEVLPLLDESTAWGPVLSRSAGGAPTFYTVRWYALKFLADAASCLSRLPREEFVLVPERRIDVLPGISDVVRRLWEMLFARGISIPLAARIAAGSAPVPIADGH